MDRPAPKYDVAISFLTQDESVARALHDRLSTTLNVFFYPRSQEELGGTDGMESMRLPFVDDSRVVVVLYRERWGKTPWTRVEEAAIKDGCLKHGWHRLFFMPLANGAPLPVWLPETHVRFNFADFGIAQAVGAIKARAKECGGKIAPVTALSRARLAQAEAEHKRKKDRLFHSQEWIQENVRPAIVQMFAEISRLAEQISSEVGMQVRSACSPNPGSAADVCALTGGGVGLRVVWAQPYTNVMGTLEISEFHNEIILPGEHRMYAGWDGPEEMAKYTFLPELSVGEGLCWIENSNPWERLSTRGLADKAVQLFVDLCQRAVRGEIDTTPAFYKQWRKAREELE